MPLRRNHSSRVKRQNILRKVQHAGKIEISPPEAKRAKSCVYFLICLLSESSFYKSNGSSVIRIALLNTMRSLIFVGEFSQVTVFSQTLLLIRSLLVLRWCVHFPFHDQ